jgi:CubicO group peptidase (beta-lactamase class C family)/D-alanyl-D-alanine dipeptidase
MAAAPRSEEGRDGSASPYDTLFQQTYERYRLPGLALGIIENGEIVYARTQGELVAGGGGKIDRATLFKIASNSKAMTTALLARLVDQGKLRWDDPVRKHLPQFRMFDPWVTKEMQVRDLLIHNSGLGLGAGDLMLWPEPNAFTRADVIAGLAYLKPTHSFRSHYAYDNILYIVAGEVAAAAGGAPYEELMRREVFAPLKMSRCQAGGFDAQAVGNVAQPHMLDGGKNVPIRLDERFVPSSTSAAAGGIRCSLDDMLTWARAWLTPNDWLSAEQRAAVWTPHMPLPLSEQTKRWENANFYSYGYGWRLSDANGRFKAAHTGTLAGMYSYLDLLPETKTGWVILINGNGGEARVVLNQALLAHFTDPANAKPVTAYADELAQQAAAAQATAAAEQTGTRGRAAATPAQLEGKLGVYRDPWFGEISLCPVQDGVQWRSHKSPQLTGRVQRVADAWLVDWDEASVDAEAWLHFAEGDRLTMSLVDPEADFSYDYQDLAFSRVRDCGASPLVDVKTRVPDLDLDMKYAGRDNFTGAPVDGYEAAKCLLLPEAADALAEVEASLRSRHYRLRIHDCYRPERAVAHFMRWARDTRDRRSKREYYPALEKSALVPDYIAEKSGHSRGATVDLTLVLCDPRCVPLDMGTRFDFFDPRANTDSPAVSERQRANRRRLRDAMQAAGFVNYPMEWWHYTLPLDPPATQAYDLPIR